MSCGTGLKTKERSIVEQATNGGKSCEGHSIETVLCKQKDCFGMFIVYVTSSFKTLEWMKTFNLNYKVFSYD